MNLLMFGMQIQLSLMLILLNIYWNSFWEMYMYEMKEEFGIVCIKILVVWRVKADDFSFLFLLFVGCRCDYNWNFKLWLYPDL